MKVNMAYGSEVLCITNFGTTCEGTVIFTLWSGFVVVKCTLSLQREKM